MAQQIGRSQHRMRKASLFWIGMTTAVLSAAILQAAAERGGTARNPDELARVALDAVRANWGSLRSGAYTVKGRVYRHRLSAPELEGPIQVRNIFDFDRNLFRFERSEPILYRTIDDDTGKPSETKRSTVEMRVIRTAEKTLDWSSSANFEIRVSDAKTPFSNRSLCPPFDVRVVGLAFRNSLDQYDNFFEQLKRLSSFQVVEATDDGKGLLQVEWLVCDKPWGMRERIWFDQQSGFCPIRVEGYFRPPDSSEWRLAHECTTSWTRINDVWLPTTAHLASGPPDNREGEYNLAFEWSQVNQPVDESKFTATALASELNLPHIHVVDKRVAPSVIVDRIGTRDTQRKAALPGATKTPPQTDRLR